VICVSTNVRAAPHNGSSVGAQTKKVLLLSFVICICHFKCASRQ